MTDFFSEFLHISQIYCIKEETSPNNSQNQGSAKQDVSQIIDQTLISQTDRNLAEDEQINEILGLYKHGEGSEIEDSESEADELSIDRSGSKQIHWESI